MAESWESEDAMLMLSDDIPGLRLRRVARCSWCKDVERCLCLCLVVFEGEGGCDLKDEEDEAAMTDWEEKTREGGGRWNWCSDPAADGRIACESSMLSWERMFSSRSSVGELFIKSMLALNGQCTNEKMGALSRVRGWAGRVENVGSN